LTVGSALAPKITVAMKFLIVDHAANTVSALRSLLQDDGHDVQAFTSGDDAVNALAREAFDAVLTELDMPNVSGKAVVQAARQYQPRACIFCSTVRPFCATPEGACRVFGKPVDYEKFARAVEACRARNGLGCDGQCYLRAGT
jgi:DNA-binding NtrC family response regulator